MENNTYSFDELSVFFNRALDHQKNKSYLEAEVLYNKILGQIPTHADTLHYLGLVKYELGFFNQAVELIKRAIEEAPDQVEMLLNLAIVLQKNRQFSEARETNLKLLAIDAHHAMAHNNLSQIYNELGDQTRTDDSCVKAYALSPQNPAIVNEYANYCIRSQHYFKALDLLIEVFKRDQNNAPILFNIISILYSIGDFSRVIDYFGRINSKMISEIASINQYCFFANYNDSLSMNQLYERHLDGAKLLFDSFLGINEKKIKRKCLGGNEKLKIAYVSADFHFHSVSFFIKPILENHDSSKFDVYCYSNQTREDETTKYIKTLCFQWREIKNMSDRDVRLLIARDEIDILVDLSGYSAGNRLGVFANRSAPLQVTYLGYPNTTGLNSMDYRITDEYTDPVGMTEHLNSEGLARLQNIFLCYSPDKTCPQVSEPPVIKNGFISFGSFNNMAKINDKVVELWSGVLRQFPNSKLFLKSKVFADEDVKKFTLSRFEQFNIDKSRIIFKKHEKKYTDHMNSYKDIDISLDTFPYNGTTTTCESLWMGVPVIALLGESHISRVSASILNAVGLNDLIATQRPDFVEIAISLASNQPELENLRFTMREKMQSSGFTDGLKFTAVLEDKYRELWRRDRKV